MEDIYDIIRKSVYSESILDCGPYIVQFAPEALKCKNRATLVRDFYSRVATGKLDYYFDQKFNQTPDPYYLKEGKNATWLFLNLTCPTQTTPIKTLNALLDYGHSLETNYVEPIGGIIKAETVNAIIDYLNRQYDFCKKVFADRKPIILLLNCSNKHMDAEYQLNFYQDKTLDQHFLVYHANGGSASNPEAIFFHELGHALFSRWTKITDQVPPDLAEALEMLCFKNYRQLDNAQQTEILMDVLSVGMMYGSPFSQYDFFEKIHEDDKKQFRKIFEGIISLL